jgi:hypothetical protein
VLAVVVIIIIIGVGVFSAALVLVQQQASATTSITLTASQNNKCSGGDIVTCTHSKKTAHHSTKEDSTPFDIPLPFP